MDQLKFPRLRLAASDARFPKSIFRAEGERRPFRRGDLAILLSDNIFATGSIVLVCASESTANGPLTHLPVLTIRGVLDRMPARKLSLLVAVDLQEYGPSYDELACHIASARNQNAPAGLASRR